MEGSGSSSIKETSGTWRGNKGRRSEEALGETGQNGLLWTAFPAVDQTRGLVPITDTCL